MKGYVVCVYKSISNEEKLKEYAVKARAFISYALIQIFTGKFGKTSPAIWVIAVFSVISFYVA